MEILVGGLLAPHTDVELALATTCLRLSAYARTVAELTKPHQFQAVASSARSIFELCADVHLLTVPDLISNPVAKFHEFTRVSRFRSAKKMVAFYDAHPDVKDRTSESRAFLQTPNLERLIDEAAKALWGTNKRNRGIQAQHWSGLDLAHRAEKCGLLYEEAYNRFITWFNWYVHSGASGKDS